MSVLVGAGGDVAAMLHLSLVEAASGELLWSNAVALSGDFEHQGLANGVAQAFQPFRR